jgi:hypothetical protein
MTEPRSLYAFFRRVGIVLAFPLIVTGALGNFMLGEDYSYGVAHDLAGNAVWLLLITLPIWLPLYGLWWLVTGKGADRA